MATPHEIRAAVAAVARGEIRYRYGIYEGGPEWQVIHEVLRLGLAERDPEGGDVPVELTDAGRAFLAGERFMFELTLAEVDDLVSGYFDAEPEALERCEAVIRRLDVQAGALRKEADA